jgi:hypothetical protein
LIESGVRNPTVGPCRDYVARLHTVDAAVNLVEYPGAHHVFDNQAIAGTVHVPQAPTDRKCPSKKSRRLISMHP